jgi:multidrug efflux pump subunit AcrB
VNRIVEWFARNGVAANLMVLLILAGGLLTIGQIKKEVFPEIASDRIEVSVVYPGAAPEEVEEGICVRIEEAIQGVDGIKQITSVATEGFGAVTVELLAGADSRRALEDVKARVDAIDTFPEQAEKPVVQELTLKRQVLNVAVSGEAEERTLKRLGERVRDEVSALPGITQVELVTARPYEIAIELSEDSLRHYGVTFSEVADAVRRSSLDLPGGSLRTEGGEILLRTKGQAYRGADFERIVLRALPDGTRLLVGDVARVNDGFAETDQFASFDGKPAVMVQVFRTGAQSALAISATVKEYVREAQARMPEGISLTLWQDDSNYLKSRIELLTRNGFFGLILVFLMLALFLRFRLALWVSFGIFVSFLGTFWLLPLFDVSINLMSMFAFVLVLGIVVDDAILVGENIYAHQQRHRDGLTGAIRGAQEVAKPVIFAVLTTVAAFLPLLMVPGNTGKIIGIIPIIVIVTIGFSLVESLLVLPAHLRNIRPDDDKNKRGVSGLWRRFQSGFSERLERFVERVYQPVLKRCLHARYLTVAVALFILLSTVGLVGGGWIKSVFFSPVEGDNVAAMLTMPLGTPADVTARAVRQLEESALQLRQQIDGNKMNGEKSVFRHMLASVGEQPFLTAQRQGAGNLVFMITGAHLGEVHIELAPSEEREGSSTELANRWRELTGPIPGAEEVTFTASVFTTGEPINVQLSGLNLADLREAAAAVKMRLAEYPGVTGIADSFRAGKQEIKLEIKPAAEALGLTLRDLGAQVRQAFYGEEAQRIQRGRDEVKVMVRYPEDRRRSLADLEQMRIRMPDGVEIPFSEVAEVELGRGYSTIRRVDRRRAINITAEVDQAQISANDVAEDLKRTLLAELVAHYPGMTFSLEGERREQAETVDGLMRGFVLALILIYALLAIPFRSYIQPIIVMAAIPFGLVGAVLGHVIMGIELTILSMFGLVALSGVVVNDSLVLVDFINRKVAAGIPLLDAVRSAGAARFRPIVLTSLTTFAGLTPLLLERSVQAQFLIPMAVSLGFGVIFCTFISLLLVPSLYLILQDLHWAGAKVIGSEEKEKTAVEM